MTDWAMEGVVSSGDRELQSLQNKYNLAVTFSDGLKSQLAKTADDLQRARNENLQLSLTCEAAKSQNDTLLHENKSLANAKVELAQLLEREKNKVARLKETVSNIEAFNSPSKASTLNCSTANEEKLREIELQFKEKRFNCERNFYNEQIKQMSDELESKNAELLELRKKLNISTMEANLKLEQQSAEINSCHLENNRLKAIVENNQTAHAELKKKYTELEANYASLESNFNKQINGQTEVINMLMKQSEDLKSQVTARDDEIEILRDISKKGVEAHEELEATFNEMKNNYIKDVSELETERDRLLEELDKLKQETSAAKENLTKRCIENEFQKAFPLVYESSFQLNGVVSLTDIYQQMTRLKQEKDTLAAENAKMSALLEGMEAKINEDTPVMYRNMQNYKQLSESYEKLEKNLLILMTEKQSLVDASDFDRRQIHALQREVKRYEVECNNLSIQIQHLMRSLVEAQQGFSINDSTAHSEMDEGSSGPVPANMITFKDIQSCQEQNRNLMRYIHSLVEGDESSQKSDEKLKNLCADLDNCKKEIERLQNELAKRDTLDGSIQRSRGDSTLDAENMTLRAKVDKYQQDIEICRQQHLEQVRKLDADKNNLISENVTFKSQIAKLAGDLEEKVLLLANTNITMEKLELENNALRERNIKLNSTIEHLEKSIIYVKSELEAAKQALKDAENKAALSRSERDVLKNAEVSLIQENAQIREELEGQKRTIYQLQAIQANNQESEREAIRSLQMQCENLKANTEFYREKSASDEAKWANQIATFSNQINNLQALLEKEKNNNIEWQRKYFELQQKLNQQLEKGAVFAQQTTGSESSNYVPSADQKRQIAHLQDEIKVLKGKLANSESSCESLKEFNATLEENLAQMVMHNEETRKNVETELQNKVDAIRQLEQEIEATRKNHESMVAEKDAKIEQIVASAAANESQIEELKQLLIEAKAEARKAMDTEQSLQDDLIYQKVIASKLQEDYEAEAALRSTDATTIIGLKLELEMLQKTVREKDAENEKLKDHVTRNIQIWETRIKELNLVNEKLQIEHNELKSVNEVLLNQNEQLNNQLIALQSNSSLFAQDENTQKENASQMAGVVKFYRDENAQLQSKLSKLNDEYSCLKIDMDNCQKEIENFKSALEAERQSTVRLSNSTEYKELFAKAELVPVLTENASQMRIEISKLEQRNKDLLEKVTKLEMNAKEVSELSSKAEGDVVERQFLRNEIEQWKAKANSLTQQLKNFDSESLKRVMAEKTQLSKSNQSLTLEKEKLVTALEQANKHIQEEADEKARLQAQCSKQQKINTQLRNLALKYKTEAQNKASGSASADKEETLEAPSASSQETAAAAASTDASVTTAQLEELQMKLQLLEEENKRLLAEIELFKQKNELLQKTSNETDEKAKKVAEKAKQRISEMLMEKASLTRERDTLAKEVEALKAHIFQLQSNDEHRSAYCDQLKTEYESRLDEQERLIDSLNLQINEQQMIVASTAAASTLPSLVSSDTVATSAAPASGSPLQSQPTTVSSVNPQVTTLPLATKTTPTASIKPLIDASAGRTSSQRGISRPVTVVQPTANADESTLITTMSQPSITASIQPTQAQAAASTTSVSSTCVPSSTEVSEASTSENTNVDSISFAPSTSTGFAGEYSAAEDNNNKRTLDDASDEPSTSSNLKKFKSTAEEDYGDEEYEEDEHDEEDEEEDEEDENESSVEEDDQEGDYNDDFHGGGEEREAEGEEEEDDENEHEADELEDEYDESSEEDNKSIEIIDIDDDDDEQPPQQQQVSGNNAREEVSSSFVSRPGPSNSNQSEEEEEDDADAND